MPNPSTWKREEACRLHEIGLSYHDISLKLGVSRARVGQFLGTSTERLNTNMGDIHLRPSGFYRSAHSLKQALDDAMSLIGEWQTVPYEERRQNEEYDDIVRYADYLVGRLVNL